MLAAACGSGRAEESKALIPRDAGNLGGTEWQLALTDRGTNVPATPRVTLGFDADHASGMGPCNRYRLPFTHDGSRVTTGPLAATQIACRQSALDAEHRYFNALQGVDHVDFEMHRLVLTGRGDVRLVYTRTNSDASPSGSSHNALVSDRAGSIMFVPPGAH